jgi:hypothetical protein
MPEPPGAWWELWWWACGDDPGRFGKIRRMPIYTLWWWAERQLATDAARERYSEMRAAGRS